MKWLSVYWPWSNAGCWGIRWRGGLYYLDVFRRPYFGLYFSGPYFKVWWKIFPWRLLRVEVVNPEACRRLFRRTLRPFMLVQVAQPSRFVGETVEVLSYPFVNEFGLVRVVIRTRVGDPTSLRAYPAAFLRPLKLFGRTGVPADDLVF